MAELGKPAPAKSGSLLSDIAPPILLIFTILVSWEILVTLLHVSPIILPKPSAIGVALAAHYQTLIPAALTSLWMMAKGLFFATIMGIGLGALCQRFTWVDRALMPIAMVIQAVPIVAIAPLIIIWSGIDHPQRAITILAVIMGTFPVWSAARAGFAAIDPNLSRLFSLYHASDWQRFWRLHVPSSAPFLISGMRIAAGLCLVGVVVAEFVAGTGVTGGLAWALIEAGNRLQTAAMFAALLLLAVMGIGLHILLSGLERALKR